MISISYCNIYITHKLNIEHKLIITRILGNNRKFKQVIEMTKISFVIINYFVNNLIN